MTGVKTCEYPGGCDMLPGSKESGYLCREHYAEWLAYMHDNGLTRNGNPICTIPSCRNKSRGGKGMCKKHAEVNALP